MCKDHGYLAGEQYTCPHCGQKTEVYSRITGYYRPVQNWNDGKSQEFQDRKLYVIESSKLKRAAKSVVANDVQNCAIQPQKLMLFTTKTCPNCKIVKAMLAKANVAYEEIDASQRQDLAKQYGIMQAPTLIVTDGERFEKIANASEIRKYIEATA